ncbi:MAG TPA: PIG-L family deacetylase [Ktedonobacterales bacterium]
MVIPLDETKIELGRQLRAWLAANKTILIFEPHSDDTALSMGDFFSQLSDAARQQTHHVTVFSKGRTIAQSEGEPGLDALALQRKAEAIAAYTSLGIPAANITFLDHVDFAYRRIQHTSLAARALRPTELVSTVLGYTEMYLPVVSPRDRKLLRSMTEQFGAMLQAYANPVCFVPRGEYARHIDHYLVRVALEQAVRALPPEQREKVAIIYYDDHPYNLHTPLMVPPGAVVAQHPVNRAFKASLFQLFETQQYIPYSGDMPPDLPPEQFIVPHEVARQINAAAVLAAT